MESYISYIIVYRASYIIYICLYCRKISSFLRVLCKWQHDFWNPGHIRPNGYLTCAGWLWYTCLGCTMTRGSTCGVFTEPELYFVLQSKLNSCQFQRIKFWELSFSDNDELIKTKVWILFFRMNSVLKLIQQYKYNQYVVLFYCRWACLLKSNLLLQN